MFSIVFHLAFLLAILWWQRRRNYSDAPWKLALGWYLVGVLVMMVENWVVTARLFSILTLQGALIEILYSVAAGFAFRHAKAHRGSLWKPFLVFVGFSVLATLVAGLLLARANIAQGLGL